MKAILFLVVFAFSFVLSGCAEYQAFKAGVTQYGGQYEQEKLTAAEWFVCSSARVGAVIDRYRGRLDVWADFCTAKDTLDSTAVTAPVDDSGQDAKP